MDCFEECKKILLLLESLVQTKMLSEIMGGAAKSQIDINSPPMPMSNELSLMTMHDFEDHFIQEITEKVN